jgi:rubredoxin
MTVLEKHRSIKDLWVYGVCKSCGYNPKEVKMVKETMVSGDPEGKYRSKKKVWMCPRCGYTRKL